MGRGLKEEIGCEGDELHFCVVCCSQVELGTNHDIYGDCKLLSNNLDVIFVVKKVLQVPDSELEKSLVECGDPVNWISLCEQCRILTRQAQELEQKIVKIQSLIVERFKASSLPPSLSSRVNRKTVWRRTREFARENKPTNVNPFIEGDKLAEYFLTRQQQCAVSLVIPDKQGDFESEQDAITIGSLTPCQNIKLEDDGEEDRIVENDWVQEDYNEEEMELKMEVRPKDDRQEVCLGRRVMKRRVGSHKTVDRFGGSSLSVHKRRNQKIIKINGKFKCRYCDKLFGAMSTCTLHEKEKHPKTPGGFPCDICGKPWNSRDYLRDHRRSVHGIAPDGTQLDTKKRKHKLKLERIKRKRSRSSGLEGVGRNKRKVERVDGKWKCRHCDQLFGALSSCYLHEREKHSRKPGEFICDICGKPWNSRDYLRDHRRSVHGVNPDGTQVITKKKKEQKKLEGEGMKRERKMRKVAKRSTAGLGANKKVKKEKVRMEFIDGKWKCRHCDLMFSAKSSCYLHEREKHARQPGEFICDICGKCWNSRDYLRDHRRSTHGVNPDGSQVEKGNKKKAFKKEKTKCQHCNIVFASERSCYYHEQEKHADKPEGQFICDICGQAWNTSEYFRKHRRSKHSLNADGSQVPVVSKKTNTEI